MTKKTELVLEEEISQPYQDCVISAGLVEGHPVGTHYLRFSRDGEEPTTIFLRPDETAAIAWVTAGLLWSHEFGKFHYGKEEDNN